MEEKHLLELRDHESLSNVQKIPDFHIIDEAESIRLIF